MSALKPIVRPLTAGQILAKLITVDGSGSGLDAALLLGATWAAPAAIGSTTPAAGTFTTAQVNSTLGVTGLATLTGGATSMERVNLHRTDNTSAIRYHIDLTRGSTALTTAAAITTIGDAANGVASVGIAFDGGNATHSFSRTAMSTTGTLAVTGTATLSSTLTVAGPVTVTDGLLTLGRTANAAILFKTGAAAEAQLRITATKVLSIADASGAAFLSVDTTATTGGVTIPSISTGLTIAKTTGTTLTVSSTAAACASFGGGLTIGAGVKFPATQVSSADANTLDDYEEGTWTATITLGSGTATFDASFNTGAYTKVGRMVVVTGEFRLSAVSTPGGSVTINGLPFAVGNFTQRSEYASCPVRLTTITGTMNGTVFADLSGASSSFLLQAVDGGTAADIGANLTSTTRFTLMLVYFTD